MQKKTLILDGGVGTEIQRRGYSLHKNTWSALAHYHHPVLVEEIHYDYINAGADIITTNTFSTAKHLLRTVDLEAAFEEINQSAVRVAKQARERARNSDIVIAGSISTIPDLERPDRLPVSDVYFKEFRQQAEILVDAGVDILLAEMMIQSEATEMIIEACSGLNTPIWVGLSASCTESDPEIMAFRTPGKYQQVENETFENLVKTISQHPLQALGIMHTKVELIPDSLKLISKYWRSSKMAYAQIGETGEHDWKFSKLISPADYVEHTKCWVESYAVDIIGGCCGTSPQYTKAIAKTLTQASNSRN